MSLSNVAVAMLATMAYPVFTGPSVIQGIALLYFVPYFRRSVLAIFGIRGENGAGAVAPAQDQDRKMFTSIGSRSTTVVQ